MRELLQVIFLDSFFFIEIKSEDFFFYSRKLQGYPLEKQALQAEGCIL